ncbi:hypothetical protein ATER59S_01875 [Aquamicrobium terrae]
MARFLIYNFAGTCVLAWAWWQGYIGRLVAADAAGMVYVIAVVFAVGLAASAGAAVGLACAKPVLTVSQRQAMHRDIAFLHDIFAALFILGIIGNAIGFLMAFSGIDLAALDTADGIRKAGAKLLSGSGTAFGSTIVGLSLALWMSGNLRILTTSIDRRAP